MKVPPFNRCPAVAIDEPALCLVCGQVLSAGNRLSSTNAGRGGGRSPGECTIHAKSCGGGTGLFYLVERYLYHFHLTRLTLQCNLLLDQVFCSSCTQRTSMLLGNALFGQKW